MTQTFAVQHDIAVSIEHGLQIRESNLTWLPINTARTASGAWVSLAKLVGEERSHPVPMAPSDTLSNFTVVATQVDLSIAAKLGIGAIFGGTINYNDRAFYLDASAYTDKYTETPGAFVFGTRWGVGLRVLLHVSEIKGGLSLNFGMVGAAVQLGYAKALYEIDGIGIGLDGMQIVLGEIHAVGDFSAETYFKINDSVIPKLAEYLKNNANKLIPQPYQVQVIQPFDSDPITAAKPILFAMRRLNDGCTFNEALEKAAGKYGASEINAVYGKLVPGLGHSEEPSEKARDAAGQWLRDN
jgi:hypothetical protein